MRLEPSRFVRHAEHAFELLHTHALAESGPEVKAPNPFAKRNARARHYGADNDREVLAALVALAQAGASAFALKFGDRNRVYVAAMQACRTIGPAYRV